MFVRDTHLSLATLRELFDQLPQAVMVLGSGAGVRVANRAAHRLAALVPFDLHEPGCELGRLFGRMWGVDGRRVASSEAPWNRLARGESFSNYELHCDVCKHLPVKLFSFSGTILRQEEASQSFPVLTVDDVSHRLEADALFRTVFDQGPVPVSIISTRDWRFVDVNPAFAQLVGRERSELAGRTAAEMSLIVNEEEAWLSRERWRRGEEVERVELVLDVRGGHPVSVQAWYRQVELNGEVHLLAVYVDVTEQKAMDRKLREATSVVMHGAAEFSRVVIDQLEKLRSTPEVRQGSNESGLLTPREREVMTRVGAGHSNLRIAQELSLTPQTVRNYVTRIYRKVGVSNRAEAVVWARERGMVRD